MVLQSAITAAAGQISLPDSGYHSLEAAHIEDNSQFYALPQVETKQLQRERLNLK